MSATPDPEALPDTYILEGHTPVPVPWGTWAAWWKDRAHRRVAESWVTPQARVSTIFLGLDHRHGPYGPPILFETMVFWEHGELDQEQERYATWDTAEAGHAAMVARVRDALCAGGPDDAAPA